MIQRLNRQRFSRGRQRLVRAWSSRLPWMKERATRMIPKGLQLEGRLLEAVEHGLHRIVHQLISALLGRLWETQPIQGIMVL
jgi:hypothetical protein